MLSLLDAEIEGGVILTPPPGISWFQTPPTNRVNIKKYVIPDLDLIDRATEW